MDDELESIELRYLREKALSTQKQKRRELPASSRDQFMNSEIGKLFKNEKLRHKKSTPEIARVFDNPPLVPRGKRNRPSRSLNVSNTKRQRRLTSASSSRSSYSTSSRSRSRSSYSTSRSSSRSRSSASSRSSSYSNSRSNSYSHSPSSRSQSRSPTAVRPKPRKVLSSGYQNKVEQPYRSSADIDKHRPRHSSPPPLGVRGGGRGGGRQEYSGVRCPTSPQPSDWYHQRGSYERTPTKSGSDRRPRPSAGVHSSSSSADVYRREAESRHHKSPPPPHRRQHGEYLRNEDPYMRSRQRTHQRNFSPPPPRQHWTRMPPSPPPPPPPPPHRHPSPPPRERRVVSRRSPPPPPPPHRPHLSRDQFGEHLHHSRTTYQSPPSRHRRAPPPPPPPISASRSRRPNPHHAPERERERGRGRPREEEPRRPARRDEGLGRNADWTRRRSPEPRDTRGSGSGGGSKRDRDRYPPDENSLRLHKQGRNHRSDSGETGCGSNNNSSGKKSPSGHAQKENEKSSSKRLQSVLSVLDPVRVSPAKTNLKVQSSPQNGTDPVGKTAEKPVSDRDLLGDYEFNPFVDEELDYDEDMEDPSSAQPDPEADSGEDSKEEEEGAVTEDKEVEEVSSVSAGGSVSPSKPVSPENISSDYIEEGEEGEEEEEEEEEGQVGVAISSPIRVSPDRLRRRDRKSGHQRESLSSSAKSKQLSVKDRLFVSRKTIEEKRKNLGHKQPDSLRPSLANRLGPSPSDRRNPSRFPAGRSNPKGSAIEIAKAFKKKKMEEGKREEDKHKVKAMAKMINSHSKGPALRSSPLSGHKEDQERALDQRITRIKERNKVLERREKEIEKDKRLYS